MTDAIYGVEMYVRFALDQAEFRFFAPISRTSVVADNAVKSTLIGENRYAIQMADVVINLSNNTLLKSRYPEFELTVPFLNHVKSLPLTEYEVVKQYGHQQYNPQTIGEFKGEYHFLSNFHPVTFVYRDILWPNSEAAYQAMKSLDRDVHLEFARFTNPVHAKRAGRQINPIREDWNKVKVDIMRDIVYEKFNQNPELKQKLLTTGTAILQEGNTHGDRVWGVCPPYSDVGENYLGEILMTLRRDFRVIGF